MKGGRFIRKLRVTRSRRRKEGGERDEENKRGRGMKGWVYGKGSLGRSSQPLLTNCR